MQLCPNVCSSPELFTPVQTQFISQYSWEAALSLYLLYATLFHETQHGSEILYFDSGGACVFVYLYNYLCKDRFAF